MLSKEYLAGFIDGEGHLALRINKDKRTDNFSICVKLCVVNINKEVIEEISKLWNRRLLKRKDNGDNQSLYEVKIENIKEIKSALESIIDYLIVKKQKAKIMLEYCNLRMKNFNRRYSGDELGLVKKFQGTI